MTLETELKHRNNILHEADLDILEYKVGNDRAIAAILERYLIRRAINGQSVYAIADALEYYNRKIAKAEKQEDRKDFWRVVQPIIAILLSGSLIAIGLDFAVMRIHEDGRPKTETSN